MGQTFQCCMLRDPGRQRGEMEELLETFETTAMGEQGGTQLTQYAISPNHPRGICLLINNEQFAHEAEENLQDLFTSLSFDVKVQRNLKRREMIAVAEEFAKKDHSNFDSFVFIIMSRGQGNDIWGVDGRTATLEQLISEYKPTKCKSLRDKPKLFFVQRFTFLKRSNVGQRSTDLWIEMQPSFPLFIGRDNCPGEADFLLACVTSAVDKANPAVPEVFFPQVLIDVIKEKRDSLDVLDILTIVNKRMADKQRSNGVMATQVPYQNQTLRAKVQLGLTKQSAGPTIPDAARYELHNGRRGYCVIINNVKFKNSIDNRSGADKDEDCLRTLFNDLQFKVVVKRDLTKHQMENLAAKYSGKDHTPFNAFVMIVMSHGAEDDFILGVDENSAKVEDLMKEFQETRCPSLKNKPKVFIIQACRGSSSRSPADNVSSPEISFQADSEPCENDFSSDSTLPRSVAPTEADFLLAFATVPGYVAYRSIEDGTYFIQSLVKTIKEHRLHYHILEILMLVIGLVVKVEENANQRRPTVQVPACVTTLTKLLYLCGRTEDEPAED